MRKIVAAVALLLVLTGCDANAQTSAPAQDSKPVQLVASTQSEAFQLCRTLPEDMIPDCLTAAANW